MQKEIRKEITAFTYRSRAEIVGGSAVNSYAGGGSFGMIVSITCGACFQKSEQDQVSTWHFSEIQKPFVQKVNCFVFD